MTRKRPTRCRTAFAALALILCTTSAPSAGRTHGHAVPAATPAVAAASRTHDDWKGFDLSPYYEMEGVTHSRMSKAALQFIPQLADKAESITMLATTAKKPAKAFEKVRNEIDSDSRYESLASAKNEELTFYIYGHGQDDSYDEMLCFVQVEGIYTVAQIMGKFTEKDLTAIMSTIR